MPRAITTQKEWANYILRVVRHFRRLDSQRKEDVLKELDLTEALAERRKRAILHTVEQMVREHGDDSLGSWDPNYIGKRWVALCITGDTYAELESEHHILRGAAIWILDQIANERETRQKLIRLLPTDERNPDAFYDSDYWHPRYSYDLIQSLVYVLRCRNFDTAIIRSAEALWIQPNAMPHTMYYRIIDQARRLKKPVRYFTNASAALCAQQVAQRSWRGKGGGNDRFSFEDSIPNTAEKAMSIQQEGAG